MSPAPQSIEELSRLLARAHEASCPVQPWNLQALNRILEHTPEDMTVAVEAGVTLAELQARLRVAGQWLPIDPPRPEQLTIESLLSMNASGPRRFGHGTIREHLIGLKAVLADGRITKSGGKVVKNVAGYDLMKLFIGSQGTLGVMVEAIFKVQPLPESEQLIGLSCDSREQAAEKIEQLWQLPVNPVVLDLHNLRGPDLSLTSGFRLVVGFAGTMKEVESQLAIVGEHGTWELTDTAYDGWLRLPNETATPPQQQSVLPSGICAALAPLQGAPFVARAGNGVIYYRSTDQPFRDIGPAELMRRVKATFDPRNILPALSC